MSEKTEEDVLGFYGEDAQLRVVRAMMLDFSVFTAVSGIIRKNTFSIPGLYEIAKAITDYNEKNGSLPSMDALQSELKASVKTKALLEKVRIAFSRLSSIREIGDTDNSVIVENCVNAVKNIHVSSIFENAAKYTSKNRYNEAYINEQIDKIQEAMGDSSCSCTVTNPFEQIHKVFPAKQDMRVPTGIKFIDERICGGLRKGTVGLVIAGTGVGKTTLASIIAYNSAKAGSDVIQLNFEDPDEEIHYKYYSAATGLYSDYLSKSEHGKDEILDYLKSHKDADCAMRNRMHLIKFKSGEAEWDEIKQKLKSYILRTGKKPDLIIIDYLSCIMSTSNQTLRMTNECEALERLMKRIEAYADENGIAIWVFQQTNRSGMVADTANQRMANIQGSFRATQPASIIMYLDRTSAKDGDYNSANLYIDKCRGAEPYAWTPLYLNRGNCQIKEHPSVNEDSLEYDENAVPPHLRDKVHFNLKNNN